MGYNIDMNEYPQKVVDHYTQHRNSYRSTDSTVFPLVKKTGIKDKVILDFGCGHGVDALEFVKLGAKKVVGIDPSKPMIELAKQVNSNPKIKFIATDGNTLPLKGNQFDLVFANFVIHYLKDTKQQFGEIARVLKPGGYFIAVFNCLTTDLKIINKRVPMILGKGKEKSRIHIVSKSPEEIKNSLQKSGLNIISFSRIANPDAKVDPEYKNIYGFKKQSFVFVARKI